MASNSTMRCGGGTAPPGASHGRRPPCRCSRSPRRACGPLPRKGRRPRASWGSGTPGLPIDHRLRDDAGRRPHDAAALHLVQDGLRQLVADVALAHGAALGKRHGRRLAVVRGGVVEGVVDHAHLRAVAVGDHHVDALGHHVHNVLGGVLHQFQLFLGRVAQGVAAQCYDDALAVAFPVCHGFTPFRMHGPKTSQDAGMRDVFRMVERLCRPERPAHPSGQSRVHDGLDAVHAVLGLVEHLGLLRLEHVVFHFHLRDAELLGDLGADGGLGVVERRKAMQEMAFLSAMAMTSLVTR